MGKKNKVIKDLGRSIRNRLLNISREVPYDYNLLLTRYVQERVLYRISQSKYKEHFFLKGSALLYAHNQFKTRPTEDIDFLAKNLNNDKEYIKSIWGEILSIPCEDDALTFEVDKLQAEDIMEGKDYHGIGFSTTALLDGMPIFFSVDIGFGDVTVPAPLELSFPVILDGMPSFNVKAYSFETVVAEKFHTMIELSIYNSRMKDFFDLYTILSTKELDSDSLGEAINATFENRRTKYVKNHVLFTEGFFQDLTKQAQWKSFLKKIKYKESLSFQEVGKVIQERLMPYWDALME